MNIGWRIKEERERLSFDQVGFAALGGASRHSQIDWEKGKSFPNANVLAAWAAVGADIQYIVTGIRGVSVRPELVEGQSVHASTGSPRTEGEQLTPREAALLDNYRHVENDNDKRVIERTALLAARADEQHETTTKKKRA